MTLTLEVVRSLLHQEETKRNCYYIIRRGVMDVVSPAAPLPQRINSPSVARILLEAMNIQVKEVTSAYWKDGEFYMEYTT